MGKGSKNSLVTGSGKTTAWTGPHLIGSKIGARELFNLPNGSYGGLGDGTGGGGSIIGLIARAFGFIGDGPLSVEGVDTGLSATTALQLLLYRSGAYDATSFIAGLDPPSAPTIAEHSTDVSTTNFGTTSAVYWFVRSATGGRSRKSPVSNVTTVSGKKVRFTVSGADLTAAAAMGADRIGVGVPQWGFGSTGPHFMYPINSGGEFAITDLTTVDGVANSLELDWASSELQGQDLAPLDDDPPPEAVFAAALEDVIAVIGAFGDLDDGVSLDSPGTVIAVSLRIYIESFPADQFLFLPGAPRGVVQRPSQGFDYIGGADYMCALSYTGADPPLALQTIWDSTGIASQGNMFAGEGGRLHVFSHGGPIRIGRLGEPETAWADSVVDDMRVWIARDVAGGWDDINKLAVFFHHKEAHAYSYPLNKWCSRLDFSTVFSANEIVSSCVTVEGVLYFSTRDTVTPSNPMKLYTLHGGNGTEYISHLADIQAKGYASELLQLEILLRGDNTGNPVTVKMYKNGDRTTPVRSRNFTLPKTGSQFLRTWRPNLKGARSFSVSVSQQSTGGDCGVDLITLSGEPSDTVI
jgi:hypothetical protein